MNCSVLTQAEIPVRRSGEVTGPMLLRRKQRLGRVESVSSSVLNRIWKLSIESLLVCVLASIQASSQVNTSYSASNTKPLMQTASAQIVPSDSASASARSIQGGQFHPLTGRRKPAHAGIVRGSLTMGAIPGKMSSLCFVPGIGWQLILISPLKGIENVDTAGNKGGSAPDGTGAEIAAAGEGSTAVYTRPSG